MNYYKKIKNELINNEAYKKYEKILQYCKKPDSV